MPMGKMFKSQRRKRGSRNIRKAVQKVIDSNLETKTALLNYVETTIDTSGNDSLITVAQGDEQSSRDGNQIRLKSIEGHFSITCADATNRVRLILYRAKNAADKMSTDGVTVDSAIDFDKYVVYKDKWMGLTLSGEAVKMYHYKMKFPGSGLRQQYTGALATSATEGIVRFFIVSDSGVVSHPTVSGHNRMRFSDA